jgi:hypothetical protein
VEIERRFLNRIRNGVKMPTRAVFDTKVKAKRGGPQPQ